MTQISNSSGPPRFFIGLYGLNRSLRWTWRSITQNILRPLADAGVDFTVVSHFHVPERIENIRTKEMGIAPVDNGHRRLPIREMRTDPQTIDLLPPDVRHLVKPTFDGDRDEDGQTRRNLLFQLRSLQQVWHLIQDQGARRDDLVLFLRPDLRYIDKLDVQDTVSRLSSRTCDLMTPDWQEWGGLNDRFAFCNWHGAEVYAGRGERASTFASNHQCLNAELLLFEAVRDADVRHCYTTMRAQRVRADGLVHRESFAEHPLRIFRTRASNAIVKSKRWLRGLKIGV